MPVETQHSRPMRFLVTAVAVAVTGLIGACSGPSTEPQNLVASVGSVPRGASGDGAGGTAVATTPPEVQGPLIRYDTSDEEEARLRRAYSACLEREGVPWASKGVSQDRETLTKYQKQLRACASKKPESVPDREQRKNPAAFKQDLREQIRCMKDRGLDVIAIPPDGWGVTDEAAARGYVPDFTVVKQCQLKAFGG